MLIEGIVLVLELGKKQLEWHLYPVLLLSLSVAIGVGLDVIQRQSLKAEDRLSNKPEDALTNGRLGARNGMKATLRGRHRPYGRATCRANCCGKHDTEDISSAKR